jgi:hypothetical protein
MGLGLSTLRTLPFFVALKSARDRSIWMDDQRHFGVSFGPSGRRVWRPSPSPRVVAHNKVAVGPDCLQFFELG